MPELNYTSGARLRKLMAIVLVGCAIILFLSGFDTIKAKAMDIKRRADVKILAKALELYHDKYGRYPEAADDWQGWDLSFAYGGGAIDFVGKLKAEGLLDREAKDPINDAAYHYRYQLYQAGAFGCANAFYILPVT